MGFLKTSSYVDGTTIIYKLQIFIDQIYKNSTDRKAPMINIINIASDAANIKICMHAMDVKYKDTLFSNLFRNNNIKPSQIFNVIYDICNTGTCFSYNSKLPSTLNLHNIIKEPNIYKNILITILKMVYHQENMIGNDNSKKFTIYGIIYDCIGLYIALFINTITNQNNIKYPRTIKNDSNIIIKDKFMSYNCEFGEINKKIINSIDEIINLYFNRYVIDIDQKTILIRLLDDFILRPKEYENVIIGCNTYLYNIKKDSPQTTYDDDYLNSSKNKIVQIPCTVTNKFDITETMV